MLSNPLALSVLFVLLLGPYDNLRVAKMTRANIENVGEVHALVQRAHACTHAYPRARALVAVPHRTTCMLQLPHTRSHRGTRIRARSRASTHTHTHTRTRTRTHTYTVSLTAGVLGDARTVTRPREGAWRWWRTGKAAADSNVLAMMVHTNRGMILGAW